MSAKKFVELLNKEAVRTFTLSSFVLYTIVLTMAQLCEGERVKSIYTIENIEAYRTLAFTITNYFDG